MSKSVFEKVKDIYNCRLYLENNIEFIIPMREDGYIFATALCKIVNKQVGGWLRLNETKKFIKKLESDMQNHISVKLIEIYKGGNDKYNQGTWIHPNLGIQLAQWCSPDFSLQVSKWIRELVITNKVELGKEKTDNEIRDEFEKIKKQLEEQISLNNKLQNEIYIKNKENDEIQYDLNSKNKELGFLKNKIDRFQKRESYPDKNVLYIITNEKLKKDRIYLFGKAVDLKIRLTTYNKSLEHEVIYHKNFKNMYHMKTAEMMLLYKLNEYKAKNTNKDRFILPEDKNISFFTNVIDQTVKWFDNIENIVVDTTESDLEDKNLPRKQITNKYDRNVVYIITSKLHLENRMYIIGKSKNLNSRLSAYNKDIDHDVVYTKQCKNKSQMNIIESMILYKLDPYRERANRDRFILPNNVHINFFMNIFDEAVYWFEKVNDDLEIIKDVETKIQERKDTKKIYSEINKEKVAEINKNYRVKNKDELLVKQKIYRETHKKQVSDGKKQWYYKNKEKVINRVKNNYNNNKTKKLEKVKEYASNNKEKIKARNSIKIICECGTEIKKYGLPKHLKTSIHKENMEKINSSNAGITDDSWDLDNVDF